MKSPGDIGVQQQRRNTKITFAGFAITFAGAILFSTKAIIVKKAFANFRADALTLLTFRMIFSLPFYIAAAFFVSSRKSNIRLTAEQWAMVIFLGLFGYYLSSLLDFVGLQYVSAGLERLILFLFPTFAVLINAVAFRQKITRTQVLALLLTYAGMVIAYFAELRFDNNSNFLLGSLLIFVCAVTYAVYIVGSGRLIPIVGGTKFTAYAMLTATVGIFIHFAIRGRWTDVVNTSEYWWYGVLLAVVATVVPTFLLANGLKRIGSNNVAIISGIGPVSTIVQAHFVLGEPVSAVQIAGTTLVVLGVLLIGWRSGIEG